MVSYVFTFKLSNTSVISYAIYPTYTTTITVSQLPGERSGGGCGVGWGGGLQLVRILSKLKIKQYTLTLIEILSESGNKYLVQIWPKTIFIQKSYMLL